MPCSPVAPVAPVAPVTPVAPVAPVTPVAPVAPVAPVTPCSPVAPCSPWIPSSTNFICVDHSETPIVSVVVVALAVAAITQQGLPSISGMACVQPFNALVGDNDASANVYVTSAVGFSGAVAPRRYNNIVALFKPSCPLPPPENTH